MINFSNEIGKRQPASKMMRADGVENSLGETRREGNREKRAGGRALTSWPRGRFLSPRPVWTPGGPLGGPWPCATEKRWQGREIGKCWQKRTKGPHTCFQPYTPGHCPRLPGAPRPTLSKLYKIWSCACLSSLRTEMTLIGERGVELGSSPRGFPSASRQSHLCTGATMGIKQPKHWLLTCGQSACLHLPESHTHRQTVAQLLPS